MRMLGSLLAISTLAIIISHAIAADEYRFEHPKVQEHGQVVRLPYAAQQPRSGSRIVVDLTQGGPPEAVNSGLDKVARFVNIYAGAGRDAADAEIVVVLHGSATLIGLKDESYGKKFDVKENPNLPLLRNLRQHGVEFVVCGQSLASQQVWPDALDGSVEHAVSALTALVNLQSQGFAYVPLTGPPASK